MKGRLSRRARLWFGAVLTVLVSAAVSAVSQSWGMLVAGLALGSVLTVYADTHRRARKLEKTVKRLGQYHLEGRIASGGMGTVYRARHALLKRPTAVKIAHKDQPTTHFEKEVLLTSALTHPNTVMVYDFGKGEDGAFYYAMEYIEGYDLEQLVRLNGPLPPARVIRVLLQIASSLEEAHQKGLVHRDVKPSNVMLTERGGVKDFVKVLDFGLAKQHTVTASGVSRPGGNSVAFAGTPGYAAPEVVAGSRATPVSDVFSLGCVAYFLLSGQSPFRTTSQMEALTMSLVAEPSPLPSSVPNALDRIVSACLAKLPEQRPASMQVLSERLKQALSSCQPWTQEDAERWWAEHPPQPETEAPSRDPSFVLRERRSGSSATSRRDTERQTSRSSEPPG